MGGTRLMLQCLGGAVLLLLVACDEEVSVGEQCPSPFSGNATVKGKEEVYVRVFGTGCAPCEDADYDRDEQGCPVYVTPAFCGEANLCLFGVELQNVYIGGDTDGGTMQPPDEDAGADGDADGGAP